MAHLAKIWIAISITKKNSYERRLSKRAYLRLCLKNDEKKNSGSEGLNFQNSYLSIHI